MIGKFQNNIRSGWRDISFRGYSQSQFNYHDQIPHDSGFHHADSGHLPHQTSGLTIPTVAPSRQSQPVVICEICDVKFPRKNMEEHKKGKRHRRLLELHEKSMRPKTSNRQVSRQIANSQLNVVIQPKTVLKSKRNLCLVEDVKYEATSSKHKNYHITPGVPAEGSNGKPRDDTSAKGLGFKHVMVGTTGGKYMKMNNGIRKPMESSKPDVNTLSDSMESLVQIPALAPPPGPVASQIMAPTPVVGSSFQQQFQHVSASQTQVSKGKDHHKIQTPALKTNDQPQSISLELHAHAGSNISTQTEDMSSDSAAIATPPPKGPMASQVFTLPLAVGSTFEQDQHVLQTEASEGKEHHEIQNHSVKTNNQPQSIRVELHNPAASNINTQTENENSDSAAIAIAPLKGPMASQVFEPPPAVGASSEPQTELVLCAEIESHVSEAIAHYESQNSTNETNIQLLPSVSVEFDAPSVVSNVIETADGSAKAEAKMDVLPTELGTTLSFQDIVCLKCGDEGFSETFIFCNKCQVYALHRYCLDGPVIFVDDVIWFCEDCEEKIVDTSSHDQCTLLQSGTNDTENSAKDASRARIELTNCIEIVKENRQQQQSMCEGEVVDKSSHDQCILLPSGTIDSVSSAKDASARTELTNCIEKVKENKQLQQNIADKSMVLISDCHNSSHHEQSRCRNNCAEAKKFKKYCQSVSESEANSSEGSVTVIDPQPIADPIWRGSLCLSNQSLGTVIGLLAHLSSLACSKVLEETRLFPEVFNADLVQRSVVWPKSFMKSGPNFESIALYFFPDNERVERAFDKLVEDIISLDLAIRTMVKNAELLVFPSTVLPIKYWRFQSKYYLWGVFRAKQNPPKTNEVVSGEDTIVDKPQV